jgi:acetolactate synthase-1/2/3 large subunit
VRAAAGTYIQTQANSRTRLLSACLVSAGGAFSAAGRIAASLGATLLCEALPARIDRGHGLPNGTRLPYFPQEAAAELAKYDVLLLLDVRRPVAQFGYK